MLGTKVGTIIVWDFLKAEEILNLTKEIEYNSGNDDGRLREQVEKSLKGCPISVITTGEGKNLVVHLFILT